MQKHRVRFDPDGSPASNYLCVPCPMKTLTPMGVSEWVKVIVATVTLVAPIKFIIVWSLLSVGWALAKIATVGTGDIHLAKPPTGWRRGIVYIMRFGVRLIMYVAGFYYVQVAGERDDRARIIVSTHHSIWDSIWLIYYVGACQAAKGELFDLPMMGAFLRALSSLPIDRNSTGGRKQAIAGIKQRSADGRYPPILVFPAACCTNTRQLIQFKRGAFEPKVPIQPVGIAYPARGYDLKFTRFMVWDLYRTLCQAVNHMTITFLPIRYPTANEQLDPVRWAANVREEMGFKLGMQLVDNVRMETDLIQAKCRDLNIPLNELKFEILSFKLIEHLVHSFIRVDANKDGYIDYDDIVSSLPLSVEFSRKEYGCILLVVKQPPIPISDYNNPVAFANYDSWIEEGWTRRITGGRPPLRPRPIDPYQEDKIELADLIHYFNQVVQGKAPRNTFLIELFHTDQYL